MSPVPESAAGLQQDSGARLRAIPSVDDLLLRPRLAALAEKSGRSLVTQAVRNVLAEGLILAAIDGIMPPTSNP